MTTLTLEAATAALVLDLAERGTLLHVSGEGMLYAAHERSGVVCPHCGRVAALYLLRQYLTGEPGAYRATWAGACLLCVGVLPPWSAPRQGDDGQNPGSQGRQEPQGGRIEPRAGS